MDRNTLDDLALRIDFKNAKVARFSNKRVAIGKPLKSMDFNGAGVGRNRLRYPLPSNRCSWIGCTDFDDAICGGVYKKVPVRQNREVMRVVRRWSLPKHRAKTIKRNKLSSILCDECVRRGAVLRFDVTDGVVARESFECFDQSNVKRLVTCAQPDARCFPRDRYDTQRWVPRLSCAKRQEIADVRIEFTLLELRCDASIGLGTTLDV